MSEKKREPRLAPFHHRAKGEAFAEAAAHLDQLAKLADGPNADIIVLTLLPAAQTFRLRATRELEAAENAAAGRFASGGSVS